MKKIALASGLVFVLTAAATTATPYETEMQDLLETMRTNYGPLELKRETIGYDWNQAQADAMKAASSVRKSSDFYFAFADLLNSLDDAHVSIQIPSSLVYSLPLQFSSVQGSVRANYIDRGKLPRAKCAIDLGDELVTINGKTPDEMIATQPIFRKYGNPITNKMMFARMITNLQESNGTHLADFDHAKLELAKANGTRITCDLAYEKKGLGFIDRDSSLAPTSTSAVPLVSATLDEETPSLLAKWRASFKDPAFAQMESIMDRWHTLVDLSNERRRHRESGSRPDAK